MPGVTSREPCADLQMTGAAVRLVLRLRSEPEARLSCLHCQKKQAEAISKLIATTRDLLDLAVAGTLLGFGIKPAWSSARGLGGYTH